MPFPASRGCCVPCLGASRLHHSNFLLSSSHLLLLTLILLPPSYKDTHCEDKPQPDNPKSVLPCESPSSEVPGVRMWTSSGASFCLLLHSTIPHPLPSPLEPNNTEGRRCIWGQNYAGKLRTSGGSLHLTQHFCLC